MRYLCPSIIREAYGGSTIWRNPQTNKAFEVNGLMNVAHNYVFACDGSSVAKKFDSVVAGPYVPAGPPTCDTSHCTGGFVLKDSLPASCSGYACTKEECCRACTPQTACQVCVLSGRGQTGSDCAQPRVPFVDPSTASNRSSF